MFDDDDGDEDEDDGGGGGGGGDGYDDLTTFFVHNKNKRQLHFDKIRFTCSHELDAHH